MQQRTRDLLMRHRTQVINALRAHLAQLGITAARGREGLRGWPQTVAPSVQSVKSVCVDGVSTLLKSVNWCRESVYTTFCGVIKEGVKGRNAL
jgi:transposase